MVNWHRIFSHSGVYAISAVISRISSLLLLPLYTNFLGPEDYGILALLEVTGIYIAIAVNAGFNNAMMRFYYDSADEFRGRDILFSTCLSVVCVIGITAIAVIAPAAWFASERIFGTDIYALYLLLTAAAVAVDVANGTCLTLLRLQERPSLYLAVSLFRLTLSVAMNVWLIAGLQIGILGFVISSFVSALATFAFLCVVLVRKHAAKPDTAQAWAILKFSAPYIPKGFLDAFIHNMGVICLTLTGNVAAVGVFAVGKKIGSGVAMLFSPFGSVWTPYMYKISKEKNATEIYARALLLIFAVLAFFTAILSIFADRIIGIVASNEFSASADIIFPIAIGSLFFSIGPSLRIGLTLFKKTNSLPLISAAGALVGFPLTYLLSKEYGAIGTGWGVCAAWALVAGITLWHASKFLYVPYPYFRIACVSLCVVIGTIAGSFINESLGFGALVILLMLISIGLSVFSGNAKIFTDVKDVKP